MVAQKIGTEKLGEGCIFTHSPDSLFLLCTQTTEGIKPMTPQGHGQKPPVAKGEMKRVHWLIISLGAPPAIVQEQTVVYGLVWWADKHKLMVEESLGVKTDKPSIKVYDPALQRWENPGALAD